MVFGRQVRTRVQYGVNWARFVVCRRGREGVEPGSRPSPAHTILLSQQGLGHWGVMGVWSVLFLLPWWLSLHGIVALIFKIRFGEGKEEMSLYKNTLP